MATSRRKRTMKSPTLDARSIVPAPMGLSFPCVGYLDDGVFDLDGEDHGNDEEKQSTPSLEDPDSHDYLMSMMQSPDTLDLALMALTAPQATPNDGGKVSLQPSPSNDTPNDNKSPTKLWQTSFSPFCDASLSAVRTRRKAGNRSCVAREVGERTRLEVVPDFPLAKETTACRRDEGSRDGARPLDVRLSQAQSLLLTSRVTTHPASHFRPSTSDGSRPEYDGANETRRHVRHALLGHSIASPTVASRRTREAHEPRDAVASSLRKEEAALGRLHVATASVNASKCIASKNQCANDHPADRRVSFAIGMEDRSSEWEEEGPDPEASAEKDDTLARASELHSSVAGQLRSVNELLKRKSYFYIDTSWSARQLPCPPTAWKRRAASNSSSVPEAGAGNEANCEGGGASAALRRRQLCAINVNVDLRLQGHWASTAKRRRVGIYSIPGEKAHDPKWKCQDAGMVMAPFNCCEDQALFAVFDGHGTNGRQAARECMDRLPKYLVSASYSKDSACAFRRSCQKLQRDLTDRKNGTGDLYVRSGTTLCAALLVGSRLTIANVGDSGCLRIRRRIALVTSPTRITASGSRGACVLGSDTVGMRRSGDEPEAAPNELFVERLTKDHKPECDGEYERIRAAGGRVFPLPVQSVGSSSGGTILSNGGIGMGEHVPSKQRSARSQQDEAIARDFGAEVPRVWRANGSGPGLAMSRSIGDKIAHSVGVTHEPETTELELDTSTDVMLVLASDGVWDVLGAKDIRKVAEAHTVEDSWSPRELSEEICRSALSAWARATSGGSDDITCIVVKTSDIAASSISKAVQVASPTIKREANDSTPPSRRLSDHGVGG